MEFAKYLYNQLLPMSSQPIVLFKSPPTTTKTGKAGKGKNRTSAKKTKGKGTKRKNGEKTKTNEEKPKTKEEIDLEKRELYDTFVTNISGGVFMVKVDELVNLSEEQLVLLDIDKPPSAYKNLLAQFRVVFDNISQPILEQPYLFQHPLALPSHELLLSKPSEDGKAQGPHLDATIPLFVTAVYMNETGGDVEATVVYENKYTVDSKTYRRVYEGPINIKIPLSARPDTLQHPAPILKKAFGAPIDVLIGNPVFDERYPVPFKNQAVLLQGLVPSGSVCIFSGNEVHNGPKVTQPGFRVVMFQACASGNTTADPDDLAAQTFELTYVLDRYWYRKHEMNVATPAERQAISSLLQLPESKEIIQAHYRTAHLTNNVNEMLEFIDLLDKEYNCNEGNNKQQQPNSKRRRVQ